MSQRSNKPKQNIHHVSLRNDSSNEEDEEPVFTFNHLTHDIHCIIDDHIKPIWLSVGPDAVDVHEIQVKIDTGVGCNVMPEYLHDEIFGKNNLQPSKAKIQAYGNVPVKVLGKCSAYIIDADSNKTKTEFQVVNPKGYAILSRETSKLIGYIDYRKVQPPHLHTSPTLHVVKALKMDVKMPQIQKQDPDSITIDGTRHPLPLTIQHIEESFKNIFDGLGDLPGGKYHLQLKKDAVPVQHAPRQVPEKKKSAYKAELDRLIREQVIVKEDSHTQWVKSVVPAVKADGTIRLCLDPKDLNHNLERNPYYMKTVEELQGELKGSKIYTVMDAKQGYWHVELDHESSLLTTFNTPWGKHRFIRLPFGLKVSGDVFQQRLDEVLAKLESITGIADDCPLHGKNDRQHDVALLMLFHAARLNGIKFNSSKMQFKTTKVKFYGQVITPQGMQLDNTTLKPYGKWTPQRTKALFSHSKGW